MINIIKETKNEDGSWDLLLDIDDETNELLETAAKEKNTTVSELLKQLLIDFIEQNGN